MPTSEGRGNVWGEGGPGRVLLLAVAVRVTSSIVSGVEEERMPGSRKPTSEARSWSRREHGPELELGPVGENFGARPVSEVSHV